MTNRNKRGLVTGMMLIFLVFLVTILACDAHCQEVDLPDAPSTLVAPEGMEAVRSGPHHVLYFEKPYTNKEVLINWWFWAPTAIEMGATIFDIHMTEEGLKHGKCVEANGGDPYPSTGKLYATNMAANGALAAFGFLTMKYKVPVAKYMYSAMMAYGTTLHVKGGISWTGKCW